MFMLNSTEHGISTAHNAKMLGIFFPAFKLSDVVSIMLTNAKMPVVWLFLKL